MKIRFVVERMLVVVENLRLEGSKELVWREMGEKIYTPQTGNIKKHFTSLQAVI